MKKKTLTTRDLREKKFFLRVPLLAIPVLTLFFWGLGGGRMQTADGRPIAKGLDLILPPPHISSIVKLDKMAYYEQSQRDSAAARQRARMETSYVHALGLDSAHTPDAIANAVRTKLEQVKRTLYHPSAPALPVANIGHPGSSGHRLALSSDYAIPPTPATTRFRSIDPATGLKRPFVPSADLDRLEKAITALQHNDAGNAELSDLTVVIEKLAELQSPHRDSAQRIIDQSQRRPDQLQKRAALVVKALPDATDTPAAYDTLHRFDSAAIEAIVPEDQVLINGGELRLELTRDILIAAVRIPAGTSVYGIAGLSGERLRVTITNIAWQGRVFPVQLQVDDEDGLPGIYIPGAPLTEATRESVSGEIGAVGPAVVSTGLAGQAANAGMTLARSFIGKKVRPVRVTIPAGYHVLLHPKNDAL